MAPFEILVTALLGFVAGCLPVIALTLAETRDAIRAEGTEAATTPR